jgi:hypothetical protein
VAVEFQGYYSLQVQGQLLAMGTATDSILFTVNDTTGFALADTSLGAWNGIRFTDTPLENDTSRLTHCCLQFSKAVGPVWHLNAGGAISVLQFGKVVISDCLIRNNSAGSPTDHLPIGGGLYLFKSDAVISDNIFLNNRAHSGGAVYMDDSNPVFSGNLISGNRAVYGAGVGMGGTCHPMFTSDVIINNIAENHGGGLYFNKPSLVTCKGVVFLGNSAVWGGGIGVGGGELHANECQFTGNYAELWGGGIAGDYATLQINHCSFLRDSSSWGSGGLHLDHAMAEIFQCTFQDGRAVFGGGFHALFSQVTSVNNQFIGNRTGGGGGIHLENSDCLIDQCHFEGNQALDGTGGAIDCWADTTIFGRAYRLTLARSVIVDNTSFVHSGAARIEQGNSGSTLLEVVVDSCQFTRNHSDVYGSLRIGGGMHDFRVSNTVFSGNTSNRYVAGPGFITNSTGSVYNCVFTSNYSQFAASTYNAHGCSLGSEAQVDFINCTFADTSAAGGVGLSVRRGSRANLMNCIFRETGYRPISLVTAADLGCTMTVNYCNIENGIDSIYVSDSTSTLIYGDGNISEDPRFANFQNGDLHLTDDSPCIGAGRNMLEVEGKLLHAPDRDIEGMARPSPQNTQTDMGAYESVLGYPVSNHPGHLPGESDDPEVTVFPNPFRESVVISYHVHTLSAVDISIYNSRGQQVETLVSAYQPTGEYQVDWNAIWVESGIYFCRIRTNREHIETVKLILMK